MSNLLLSLIFPLFLLFPARKPEFQTVIEQEPVFSDTLDGIATDGFTIDFGTIEALPSRFTKSFKYVGKEPIVIMRAWTSDPHFICDYPKEPLMPGKTYKFTICISNYCGPHNKTMGFDLSDGSWIPFKFKAKVVCPE